MSSTTVSWFLAAMSIAAAACGGGSGESCTEGESAQCACTNGDLGAQVCRADGTFGECVCGGDEPDASVIDASAADAARPDAFVADAAGADADPTDCSAPISCPAPSSMAVTLCGQLVDTETGEPIRAVAPAGAACDPGSPAGDGPCALELAVYDALGFAANPSGAAPQSADEVTVDDCGRFRALNVARPFSGLVAVAVDDSSAGVADAVAATSVVLGTAMGERVTQLTAYSTSRTTDVGWTSSAGDPFGATTFSERGVLFALFLYGDAPVAGVKVTRGLSEQPADDWYFADSDGTATRRNVDTATVETGPNGAALFIDSALGSHSGTGAEPPGCEWPSLLAATPPGVVWVQEMRAHGLGDPDLPCP